MAPSAGPNMEVAAIGGNNEPWHTSTLDSNVKGFVDRSGWAFGFNRLFGLVFRWRNISVFQHSATDRFLRKLNRRDQFRFFRFGFGFYRTTPNRRSPQIFPPLCSSLPATALSLVLPLACCRHCAARSPVAGPPAS
jgi:hypothetical protein